MKFLNKITKFLNEITLDEVIIILLGIFVFSQTFFNSDESYKYINVYLLFALKYLSGCGATACGALKALRTEYKNPKKDKKNKKRNKKKKTH